MKHLPILALCAAMIALAGCSESSDAPSQDAQTASPAPTQAAPQAPALNAQQQAAIDEAKGMPKQGVVKEMLHAAGYTYMNVDTGNGKNVWIAATMMRVKPENTVQWADAAVMHNFNSSSLHRTFDEILFVSNAAVVQ